MNDTILHSNHPAWEIDVQHTIALQKTLPRGESRLRKVYDPQAKGIPENGMSHSRERNAAVPRTDYCGPENGSPCRDNSLRKVASLAFSSNLGKPGRVQDQATREGK